MFFFFLFFFFFFAVLGTESGLGGSEEVFKGCPTPKEKGSHRNHRNGERWSSALVREQKGKRSGGDASGPPTSGENRAEKGSKQSQVSLLQIGRAHV